MMRGRDDAAFGSAACREDMKAVPFELRSDFTDSLASDGIGLDVAVNDEDGKLEVFVHGRFLEAFPSSVEAPPPSSKREMRASARLSPAAGQAGRA